MPTILGELKQACLEVLSSDPTGPTQGRIWYNTTEAKIKFDDGTGIRALLRNDLKIIIGNSGTAAQNLRLNRAAAGVVQIVLGSDATAEGSLSAALGQLSSRLENYSDAGKPAFGNAGRLIYVTDLQELQFDDGSTWNTIGSGVDSASNVGGFAEVFKARVGNDLRFKTLQSSDSSIAITQNSNDLDLAGPRQYSQTLIRPTPSFAVKSATTVNISLSGTQTIDGVSCGVGDIVLVKNQSSAQNDGVYVVASGAWARHASYDTFTELNTASVIVTAAVSTSTQTLGTSKWFQTATLTSLADSQTWSTTGTPQSFVVGDNVTMLAYEMIGGGGGGSGGYASGGSGATQGGGGGNAAQILRGLVTVTPGETVSVTPAAGGLRGIGATVSSGGGNTPGSSGGDGASSVISGSFGTITVKGAQGATLGNATAIAYAGEFIGADGGANANGTAASDSVSFTGGTGGTKTGGGNFAGGGGGGAANEAGSGGNGSNGNAASSRISASDGSGGSGGGGGGCGSNQSVSTTYYGGHGGFGGDGYVKFSWTT